MLRRRELAEGGTVEPVTWDEISNAKITINSVENYKKILPPDKDISILDIGIGIGWFIAAAVKLGYKNISAADFNLNRKGYFYEWSPNIKKLYDIETNIGDFLADYPEKFDVIHLSHVVEHIPKHSLLYVMDSIYRALKVNGTVIIRTPNMESPAALSLLFVTLGHEYGFAGANLHSLLHICNFDEISFRKFKIHNPTIKQRLGMVIGFPFLLTAAIKHRLFGVNQGGIFSKELVVTAKRLKLPPLFDLKYK